MEWEVEELYKLDNARQDAKIKDYSRYVFMDKCVLEDAGNKAKRGI
jgi:hypothetical protein